MFTCPIDYSKFPFHTANCKLRLTSFSEFNTSMLYLVHPNETTPEIWWKDDKIRGYKASSSYLTGELSMQGQSWRIWVPWWCLQAPLFNWIANSFLGTDVSEKSWSSDNYFSIVGVSIELVSKYRKYVFVYFIPTTMFTFTSWVSYLLPATSYPARTSLLVTVFLCQVGIFTAAIKDTPNSDNGKFP